MQQTGRLQECAWQYKYKESPSFVGSVSDGANGAAAQVIAQNDGFHASRSWLFMDGVASMVTNATVESNSTAPVFTTIANQRYAAGGEIFVTLTAGPKGVPGGPVPLGSECNYPGGSNMRADAVVAIHHNHTSYFLTTNSPNARVHIDCSNLTGNFSRISTKGGTAHGQMFRVSYEHDLTASKEMFGYIVLPNTGVNASNASVQMHAEGAAHVIANASARLASVVFWSPGAAVVNLSAAHPQLRVTVDAACLLLISEAPTGNLHVAASNPDQPELA